MENYKIFCSTHLQLRMIFITYQKFSTQTTLKSPPEEYVQFYGIDVLIDVFVSNSDVFYSTSVTSFRTVESDNPNIGRSLCDREDHH